MLTRCKMRIPGHLHGIFITPACCRIDQLINGSYRHHMRAFRRHKRACVSLAIIALLGNVLAMLAHCKIASLVDSVLGPLVICTASGAKLAPSDHGSGEHSAPDQCPACTSIAQFIVAVSLVFSAVAFSTSIAGGRGFAYEVCLLPLHLIRGGIRSRAPPLRV